MRCTNFNLYESIRLKSNNKIPKMKLTLILFLVCLLDRVYSNMMETLKPGKALTNKDPKKVDLTNRFLNGLLDISSLVDVNVNSPHDIRMKEPTVDKPVYIKPYTDRQYYQPNNEGPHYEQPNNERPQYPEPSNARPYYSEPNNEGPYYQQPNSERPQYQEPSNVRPYYSDPNNLSPYNSEPNNGRRY